MDLYTATITLILVMDPLGNIPVFLSILRTVEPSRHAKITIREVFFAYLTLLLFLFSGQLILSGLGITKSALSVAGGIILFLIALNMIFPPSYEQQNHSEHEPFIVPLAIPLIAGPSAIAMVLLLTAQKPEMTFTWFIAVTLATLSCLAILLCAHPVRKLLGPKGLIAVERLMGMILTTIAVQMFLDGISDYLIKHLPFIKI